MSERVENEELEIIREIMDGFASRTGLIAQEGDEDQRYLWTDAFAVQAFFGLSRISGNQKYRQLACKLIDLVHDKLGRFHPDDERKGWISGLPEEEGRKKPTAGGLRIGKKLPERKASEAFNERLEWERDGQYFHYISRWIHTVIDLGSGAGNDCFVARHETGDPKYADWAALLLKACEKFIDKSDAGIRMYWKMSTDLSRPLVGSMGAHDPLEGLILTELIQYAVSEKAATIISLRDDFKRLCAGQDWSTSDALGIGGLLLSTLQSSALSRKKTSLPKAISPDKLWSDSLYSLDMYSRTHHADRSAFQRLAFRECGMTLGLRALSGYLVQTNDSKFTSEKLDKFTPMAEQLENFWQNPKNQNVSTWTEHLDINAVTLAASKIARYAPLNFCSVS